MSGSTAHLEAGVRYAPPVATRGTCALVLALLGCGAARSAAPAVSPAVPAPEPAGAAPVVVAPTEPPVPLPAGVVLPAGYVAERSADGAVVLRSPDDSDAPIAELTEVAPGTVPDGEPLALEDAEGPLAAAEDAAAATTGFVLRGEPATLVALRGARRAELLAAFGVFPDCASLATYASLDALPPDRRDYLGHPDESDGMALVGVYLRPALAERFLGTCPGLSVTFARPWPFPGRDYTLLDVRFGAAPQVLRLFRTEIVRAVEFRGSDRTHAIDMVPPD